MMKLSDGERLIVVMLAEVMEAMKLNNEIDPSLVKKLAIDHDDWAIGWQYSALVSDTPRSDADVQETAEILAMWSYIESSASHLSPSDQQKLAPLHPEFEGFDANHDNHHHLARTMIDTLNLWNEFKGRNLNSHSQVSLARYRKMLPKYQTTMSGRSAGGLLTLAELQHILS